MFALTACTTDVNTAIVGMWKGESLKQDIQFFQDGRIKLMDKKIGVYTGSYTITDGNNLRCEFDRLFLDPVERTVKIKGNKLVLITKSGYEEVYHRQG
jgi:hypothetical protein